MRCAIWYHLHNLKNVKNTHEGVLLLVKLQPVHMKSQKWLNISENKLHSNFTTTMLQIIFEVILLVQSCKNSQLVF